MASIAFKSASAKSGIKAAQPSRRVAVIRAQALGSPAPNPEFRQSGPEAPPAASYAFPSTQTPFDNWKFAPIREATVSLQFVSNILLG